MILYRVHVIVIQMMIQQHFDTLSYYTNIQVSLVFSSSSIYFVVVVCVVYPGSSADLFVHVGFSLLFLQIVKMKQIFHPLIFFFCFFFSDNHDDDDDDETVYNNNKIEVITFQL